MNKTSLASVLATLSLMGASGAAMAAEGFYIGGSAQQSRFDSDNFAVEDVDDEDTGWKALAGFRMHPNFAVEAQYTRFGTAEAPSVALGGPFEAKAHAWSAFALGIAPVGPVDLFAKAGLSRIKADGNVGAVFFEDNSTEFAYGVGAQFNLGNLGLRAEYEKFDTDEIGDLDVISLGVTFTFGPRT